MKSAGSKAHDAALLQELMSEAAWNLCPVSGVPQGSDCYYTDDQTFTATTGQSSTVITDCPDGEG